MPVGARWALVRAGETVKTEEHIAALEYPRKGVWKAQRQILSKRNCAGYAELKRNVQRYGEQQCFCKKLMAFCQGRGTWSPCGRCWILLNDTENPSLPDGNLY